MWGFKSLLAPSQLLRQAGFVAELPAGAAAIDLDSTLSVEAIDQVIEHHVRELRMTDETRLPDDRDTLLRLSDRFQHRAVRREQAEVKAAAKALQKRI